MDDDGFYDARRPSYFGLPPLETEGDYEKLAVKIGRITDEKSLLYGDSAQRAEAIMKVLYPDGVPVSAFKNALLVVRIADKLCRIATAAEGDNEDAWKDIAGYGLIGSKRVSQ